MSRSSFLNRLRHSYVNSKNPVLVEASLQFLSYCEMRCEPTEMRRSDWDVIPRKKLTIEEAATKTAALSMLDTWMTGDLTLQLRKDECMPPRAATALAFLNQCHGCEGMGLFSSCERGVREDRELDQVEQRAKLTSLELLRNWFNGEIVLKSTTSGRIVFQKRSDRNVEEQSTQKQPRRTT